MVPSIYSPLIISSEWVEVRKVEESPGVLIKYDFKPRGPLVWDEKDENTVVEL